MKTRSIIIFIYFQRIVSGIGVRILKGIKKKYSYDSQMIKH